MRRSGCVFPANGREWRRREYRKIVDKIGGLSKFRLDRGFMEMSCALAALIVT
jgi:hypothetical protein